MQNILYLLLFLLLLIYVFYFISKYSGKVRSFFAYFSMFSLFLFILWRGIYTLPTNSTLSLIVGIIFYIAEIIGLVVFIFFIMLIHDYHIECSNEKIEITDFNPHIDVFICTYNEDIKLVLATAHAVKALTYVNKHIYVCDDGHRERLKELCNKFDLGYISRPDNKHAKAGNINYALSQTKSDFVVVLDADFIVKKNYIYRSINYFKDEQVAMVQYPQAFYNEDPFQLMNHEFYNEQELFMRFFEPALANKNALIHIGTNSIMRRSAIEAIGGIPTNSITEDMATGLLLQNKGYKTIYVNELYALGITPYNVKSLAEQRRRWARGTVQVFKHFNPLKMKGLSLSQKFCYSNAYLYWLTSFQKLIYMLIPTLFLAFNIFIVKNDLNTYFLFFIPPMVLIMLSFRLYIPEIRTLTTSHIYDSFVAPIHSWAILSEWFHTEDKFKVTEKKAEVKKGFDFKTVKAHIAIALWIGISIVLGFIQLVQGSPYYAGIIVSILWSLYNLFGLVYAILAAKNREILTDADALSIKISELISSGVSQFEINHFNYNGFRIREFNRGRLDEFEVGQMYSFTMVNYKLDISARCLSISPECAIFSFENLDPDFAIDLARFYSMKMYEAKPVMLCPNWKENE